MLPKILTRPEISYPLVAFCAFSILYLFFYDWVLLHGLWFATFLKCLPIFCLCWLASVDSHKRSKEQKFKNKILYGLLYSSLGDALLMWDYFKLGMIAFAVAHIYYIAAFGFTSLKIEYGFVLYTLCIIILYMLIHGLEGVLQYAVPVYSFILVTMVWRSLAFTHNLKEKFCILEGFYVDEQCDPSIFGFVDAFRWPFGS
ncbi:lysoplasmalogenase-like protein TMEM86A isoform X2 [Cimex lectularius]|uniref:lysoplasmalogenase n=1 Tax=Cimex lectularius TaxID=79782 RepID=A0A8I6SSV7_CIMLE|nr:lysoplasmalogenase-like protein TMEM86A isoform X2 [Cimex lectularius]